MVYLVLGMHKSGTTLVSEILHHSGIPMGSGAEVDESRGYDRGVKYERDEVFRIDNEVLDSHGRESIFVRMPGTVVAAEAERRAMDALVGSLTRSCPDWGMKEPRMCLTYPAWRPSLPPHRVIGVFRPLNALTRRYRVERSPRRAYRLVAAWHEHNLRLLAILRSVGPDGILLSYDRLMQTGSELDRLQLFVGRPLVDRRKSGMRRNEAYSNLTTRMAEAAYRLRTGRRSEETLALLEAASREAGAVPNGG